MNPQEWENPQDARRQRQSLFLEILRSCISEHEACVRSQISQDTVSRWKREDPDFLSEYERCIDPRMKNMEEGMWAAIEHMLSPERYAQLFRYPSLLQFALRGGLPHKYAERLVGQNSSGKQEELRNLVGLDSAVPDPTAVNLPKLGPATKSPAATAEWLEKLMEVIDDTGPASSS